MWEPRGATIANPQIKAFLFRESLKFFLVWKRVFLCYLLWKDKMCHTALLSCQQWPAVPMRCTLRCRAPKLTARASNSHS